MNTNNDENNFTLWAAYCCPVYSNETFEQWHNRAKKEYQESIHPDNNSFENSHTI